jgi:hypothetical protein
MIKAISRTFERDGVPRQRSHSEGGASTYVFRNTPGYLDSFSVTNLTGVAGFVQIHDATSTAMPTAGAVPLQVFPLPANEAIGVKIPFFGEAGLVAVISSTAATYTVSANTAFFYGMTRN